AGILLFLCGLGILAFALYKNSRNLAIAAVALAYYAGAISPIGGFAMFSNLLLTALGVTFLIRRRWAAIGFVCLGATYTTFLFWQFLYPQFLLSHTSLDLAPTLTYLTGYWLLFTAGAFVTSAEGFSEKHRLAFSSANTAAYFVLGTATISAFRNAATNIEFWHFTLALGIAQTSLSLLPALLAQARDRITPLISDCLLASGLSFLTIAAFAKLDGYQLSLTLAVEAALLLFVYLRSTARSERSPVLLYASMIAAVLGAAVTTLHYVENQNPLPLAPTAAAFVIALTQAHFIRRLNNPSQLFTFPSTIFIAVALAIGATGLRPHLGTDLQPLALLLAATTMTLASSWRPLRLPELAPLSAFYSYPAAVLFISTQLLQEQPYTDTVSHASLASAMAILLWWHFSPPKQLRRPKLTSITGLAALTFCAMLATAIHLRLDHSAAWQLAGGVTAIVLATFAISVRAWPLALVASVFHLLATASFLRFGQPATASTLAAVVPSILLTLGATLLLLATSKRFFASYTLRGLDGDALPDIRRAARFGASVSVGLASLTFIFWAVRFFPDYATVVIALGGLAAFAAGLASNVRTARLAALAILAFALGRILIVDVWGFATFVRFITFFVIGAVLVALGFAYNRFQENLRKYL
ncbi:MAG: DUF2339 domain-containing protein, partial [Verrucomicrobiales bacterium]|nr:DUF2339 domain-containing protein [Verrucomicrobiales bacterium]